MTFITVDLETTHREPAEAHVVEWAAVVATPLGCVPLEYTALVRPPIPIPAETSAVHHIIDEDVEYARPWEIESARLADLIAAAPDPVLVAHNADFEKHFIAPLAPHVPWICTCKCALRAWPDAPRHGNEALRYWLELGQDRGRAGKQQPHSALHDAKVTSLLLARLLQEHDLDTLLEWSREGAILPRCPIGKYRDCPWSMVDTGYLEWILYRTTDMRADVLNSARLEMERRYGHAADGSEVSEDEDDEASEGVF